METSVNIVESTKGSFDTTGISWKNRSFTHPERTIRVATSFSGIGAPERALERLGLKTKIVFACDLGERYLYYGYAELSKFTVGLTEEQKEKFAWELFDKNKIKVEKLRMIKSSKDKSIMKPFTFDEVKENLYNTLTEPKEELELVKECIDIITEGMSQPQRETFVSNLYDRKGINYVKDAFFANHQIDENSWRDDIRFMDATPYKGQVDLYVGGSPCVSYSNSGLKLRLQDTRGTLFYDFAKRIEECEPKVFIYENVASMMKSKEDEMSGLEAALSVFQSLGYKVYWQILNARDYGVPQNRRRIWVVGFRDDVEFQYPAGIELKSRLYDYLDNDILPKSGIVNKMSVRELTGTECLRLMGFHNFNVPSSIEKLGYKGKQRKLVELAGNSMVVECLMALFLQMDITKYGVDETEENRNFIQSKPLGAMSIDELEDMKKRIERMIEEKLYDNDEFSYENDDETTKISGMYQSITRIDWGLVNQPTLVPERISVNGMIKIGATNVSSVSGKEYQGSKAYSVRGISHCVLKRHSPLILVSNEVRNFIDEYKSAITPPKLAC